MKNGYNKKYYLKGKLHRIGLPSLDLSWVGRWYFNGKLHRINGHTAIISKSYYELYGYNISANIGQLVI